MVNVWLARSEPAAFGFGHGAALKISSFFRDTLGDRV